MPQHYFKPMIKSLLAIVTLMLCAGVYAQTSVADGEWDDDDTWGGSAPAYTGLGDVTIDSYVISRSGLGFSGNNRTLTVTDTLIVYGNVIFDANAGASLTIGAGNVMIVFGNLDLGKNVAALSIGAGGVLAVTGAITSTGANGQITGDGAYYSNGGTNLGEGGHSGESGVIEDLYDDEGESGYNTIEDFILDNGEIPLPVELLRFTVTDEDGGAMLEWATASESNNDYFVIERSSDGSNFQEIARIDGHGTSDEQHEYHYFDKYPGSQVVYYRLRQVDFDGKTEYFEIKRVEITTDLQRVSVYPTTVSDGILHIVSSQSFSIEGLRVYNPQGTELSLPDRSIQDGGRELLLQLGVLPSGIYFLKVSLPDGTTHTQRFFITR